MLEFLKQQKITLFALSSFGLAAAGFSLLGGHEDAPEKTRGTGELVQNAPVPRRAPGLHKRSSTYEESSLAKNPRVLVRNTIGRGSLSKPDRKQIREALRDAHLASVEERARQSSSAKKEEGTALAQNQTETKPGPSLSEAAGAVKAAAPSELSGDYRRTLLAEAMREALNSEEPWKELVAIGLVQAEIRDMTTAKETLSMAKRLAPSKNRNGEEDASALVTVSQAFARIGQLETALDTATAITREPEQNQAISSIISEHVGRQEFSAAKTLVSSLSLAQYREASLRNIAEGEACTGDATPAISTVSLISNMSLRNDALRRVAVAQARSKQWDGAMSTASLIADANVNQRALAEIIRIRIDAGDLAAAQASIWGLRDDSMRDDLFSRLSKKLATQGDINTGIRTSDYIKDILTKENTLAAVSIQQARLGDTSTAFSTVTELVNQGAQTQGVRDVTLVEADLRGTKSAYNMASMINNPDARDATFRAIAQREAGLGNLAEAMNCAESINASDCRVLAFAETALSSIKKTPTPSRQAINLLENTTQMIPSMPENSSKRNEAILKIANAYALVNRLDEAIGNLLHITSFNQRDGALEQIARDCVNSGKIEYAQNLAGRIVNTQRRERVLEDIALIHSQKVKASEAKKELERFDTNRERARFLRGIATKKE